jgi:hypothetical protein
METVEPFSMRAALSTSVFLKKVPNLITTGRGRD